MSRRLQWRGLSDPVVLVAGHPVGDVDCQPRKPTTGADVPICVLGCAAFDGLFHALADTAIIRCIISKTKLLRYEISSWRHHVREFWNKPLALSQKVRIEAYLKDRVALCLECELRVNDIVRPSAKCARLIEAAKDVNATTPVFGSERALRDDWRS